MTIFAFLPIGMVVDVVTLAVVVEMSLETARDNEYLIRKALYDCATVTLCCGLEDMLVSL